MEENNSENKNIKMRDNKLGVTIIPFNYRKSPILSIIFRSIDLEFGKYRLKIETDGENIPKKEFYSNLTEMTLVRYFLFFNLILGSKISTRL